MPKFSISATELTDTDVNFVALVKRGANRLPFRITKGDEPMLDLYKLARTAFKKADPVPAIVAVVVQKGANLTSIDDALKSVGIDVATFTKSDQGGLITATRKTDEAPEGVMLVKMGDNVMLAVSGLQKGFSGYDFSSSDFGEVHATGSFCCSASVASDMLQMTIGNILGECESPSDASTKIAKACDGFKGYMTALTSALPVQAFKADVALLKAAAADPFPAAKKHPHAGVALAIAHAAHAAASAAGQAGTMLADNAQGGTDDDQQTGPAQGQTNAKPARKADGDDDGAKAAAALAKEKAAEAKKADAGKNGTGAGFEGGAGTQTNPKATADDATNTEVDAKPGAKSSGTDSGMPAKAKAKAATRKTNGFDPDGDGDDDSIMTGESQAGEGIAEQTDADSKAATARASADDKKMKLNGGTDGSTLPEGKQGIPAKLIAKNDGDADIGKKGQGKTKPDDESGAGAQETNVQTLKSDAIMQAISALSKTVSESLAVVTKDVGALSTRVEAVATMAKKTDAALNGTVFNVEGEDAATKVQKAESRSGGIPLMDTGYSRRERAA